MNTKISLRIERDVDGIVTVVLDVNPEKPRGGVVVLDRWLIDQIRMAMEVVEAGQKPSGLILMSASSRVFVAGADLAEIDALGDEELHEYLKAGSRAFGMLSRQKCPSVAVIHKAALGAAWRWRCTARLSSERSLLRGRSPGGSASRSADWGSAQAGAAPRCSRPGWHRLRPSRPLRPAPLGSAGRCRKVL